ncbi:hypothetical protein [Nocardioides mangrovi]|uniref:Integral membrane protein n=1 Tax=Nocardioides mangrovi TaxID=2874580 RepID=A0ABS7UGY5_9ACTN|nr:hypothetical protein [Nocardioides mangrovi]MBZ5739888.1 hypothetical protein [Nocardioides mangrovi]
MTSPAAPLPVERGRARIAAYVYGNILVLGAVVSATPHTIEDGHAVIVVLATTVTTYLAHVVAHAVGAALTDDDSPSAEPAFGPAELRDALPIVSSGSAPALILLIGAVTTLEPVLVEAAAALVVVVRLVGIGLVVDRLGAGVRRRWSWLSGIVLAGISVVIVALKLAFAH